MFSARLRLPADIPLEQVSGSNAGRHARFAVGWPGRHLGAPGTHCALPPPESAAANTHLPWSTHWHPPQVTRLVDETLEMTELSRLQHGIVGEGGGGAGLSVEQRKRLSIAVELVAAPAVMFLVRPLWMLWLLWPLPGAPSAACCGCCARGQAAPASGRCLIAEGASHRRALPRTHAWLTRCLRLSSQDEPTSGLDARAAAIVMRAIQNVAKTNRTVVVTM